MIARIEYPDPQLADDRIHLRRWELDDLACIEEASADPAIPEGSTVPATFTATEGRAFIERQWGRHQQGQGISLAIADTDMNRARGLVILLKRPVAGTAGIGYWVVPAARGGGRAVRAVRLLSRWALTTAGFTRVEALVEPGNHASQRVLESAGFTFEATLRSYLRLEARRADALSYVLRVSDL